jgi:hypothetical protein
MVIIELDYVHRILIGNGPILVSRIILLFIMLNRWSRNLRKTKILFSIVIFTVILGRKIYLCINFILSYYHIIILSYYHINILSYYHIIILSYYHIIILSYYCIIILSYYHIIILSYYHIIILSYYHIIILSYYHIIILS